jgi:hypothetical protein
MTPMEFARIAAAMAAADCAMDQMKAVADACRIYGNSRDTIRATRELQLALREKRLAKKEDRRGRMGG